MGINYSRQADMFDNTKFTTPIHIIGAGATGSWVALFLAKLGIKDITVWDFDTVEEHNLPNQIYDLGHVGKPKVKALQGLISAIDIDIKAKEERVTAKQRLSGIVICLTDTMSSRKEIFGTCKMNAGVKLWIETRMGLEGGRLYVIDPCNLDHVKAYEETLYSDEEAKVSACGTSQSIVATAVQLASMVTWQVIKFQKEDTFDNEVMVDCRNNFTITRKF